MKGEGALTRRGFFEENGSEVAHRVRSSLSSTKRHWATGAGAVVHGGSQAQVRQGADGFVRDFAARQLAPARKRQEGLETVPLRRRGAIASSAWSCCRTGAASKEAETSNHNNQPSPRAIERECNRTRGTDFMVPCCPFVQCQNRKSEFDSTLVLGLEALFMEEGASTRR